MARQFSFTNLSKTYSAVSMVTIVPSKSHKTTKLIDTTFHRGLLILPMVKGSLKRSTNHGQKIRNAEKASDCWLHSYPWRDHDHIFCNRVHIEFRTPPWKCACGRHWGSS